MSKIIIIGNLNKYLSIKVLDKSASTLPNIYIDDLVRKWRQLVNPGIKLSQDSYLNVLLFADNLLVLQNVESDLQKSASKFHQIGKQYNMKISATKTKVRSH